jgi:NitT/TauT family transport system ATP-binding protein
VDAVLSAEGIRHAYDTRQGPLLAVDGIDLAVGKGEFVAIVGPSGCGKSTLLRILAGLLVPAEGVVRLDGQRLAEPRRQVGIVFQAANLMPWRTVLRNVTLPLELAGVPSKQAGRRAGELLSLVGLHGFEAAHPRELSGGMAQRVAIARALALDPEVLLLDEPFGALDALTREQMNLELLRIWRARQVTAVMVTHNLQEAVFLADRVVVLSPRPGRIRAEVPVTLPRPRRLEVTYTEFFGALARRVRGAIEPDDLASDSPFEAGIARPSTAGVANMNTKEVRDRG